MTVSGAPKMAPIEPPLPLPTVVRYPLTMCDIVSATLGIIQPSHCFYGVLPAALAHLLYLYKLNLSPLNDHTLSLPFFPLYLSYPVHCPFLRCCIT